MFKKIWRSMKLLQKLKPIHYALLSSGVEFASECERVRGCVQIQRTVGSRFWTDLRVPPCLPLRLPSQGTWLVYCKKLGHTETRIAVNCASSTDSSDHSLKKYEKTSFFSFFSWFDKRIWTINKNLGIFNSHNKTGKLKKTDKNGKTFFKKVFKKFFFKFFKFCFWKFDLLKSNRALKIPKLKSTQKNKI